MDLRDAIKRALDDGVAESDIERVLASEKAAARIAESHVMTRTGTALAGIQEDEDWKVKFERQSALAIARSTESSMLVAASVGRYDRGENRNGDWLFYLTMRDDRVRPEHAAWDGTLLRRNHSWWKTHYPPNGYNCRCVAVSVSSGEADQLSGMSGVTTKPRKEKMKTFIEPLTGKTRKQPANIDPGWASHTGIAGYIEQVRAYSKAIRDALPANNPELNKLINARLRGDVPSFLELRDATEDPSRFVWPIALLAGAALLLNEEEQDKQLKTADLDEIIRELQARVDQGNIEIPSEHEIGGHKININSDGWITVQ